MSITSLIVDIIILIYSHNICPSPFFPLDLKPAGINTVELKIKIRLEGACHVVST